MVPGGGCLGWLQKEDVEGGYKRRMLKVVTEGG